MAPNSLWSKSTPSNFAEITGFTVWLGNSRGALRLFPGGSFLILLDFDWRWISWCFLDFKWRRVPVRPLLGESPSGMRMVVDLPPRKLCMYEMALGWV